MNMCNINWDLTIKLVTVIVGVCGLWKAIIEYQKAQKWKRAEFLSKEIKEILNDFNVKRALLMLDWNEFEISLIKGEINEREVFYFTDELLESALTFHKEKLDGKFTHEEALIRLIFDSFLEKLSTLQNYIDNDLFSYKDLEPYIIYYVRIIGDSTNDRKKEPARMKIWSYIEKYRYDQVIKLLSNYGYKISTPLVVD